MGERESTQAHAKGSIMLADTAPPHVDARRKLHFVTDDHHHSTTIPPPQEGSSRSAARDAALDTVMSRVSALSLGDVCGQDVRAMYARLFGEALDETEAATCPATRLRMKKVLLYSVLVRTHEEVVREDRQAATSSSVFRNHKRLVLKLMIERAILEIKQLQRHPLRQ